MKKYLKLEELTSREVPSELDLRILAAGKLRQQKVLRRRRELRLLSGMAAAAALCIAAGVCLMPESRGEKQISKEEYASLLAMSDWTSIEQDNYNLHSEAALGNSSVTDLADNRTNWGY